MVCARWTEKKIHYNTRGDSNKKIDSTYLPFFRTILKTLYGSTPSASTSQSCQKRPAKIDGCLRNMLSPAWQTAQLIVRANIPGKQCIKKCKRNKINYCRIFLAFRNIFWFYSEMEWLDTIKSKKIIVEIYVNVLDKKILVLGYFT